MTYARRSDRTTVEITADQIDCEIYRLAARIDQLCEMVSRGKPEMNRELIDAARHVDSARGPVRKFMNKKDLVRTGG